MRSGSKNVYFRESETKLDKVSFCFDFFNYYYTYYFNFSHGIICIMIE